MVLIRFYIDGESSPSVSLFPYELAGTPSLASYNISKSTNVHTWAAELWGRNSASSWINSFPVPFGASLRMTLQHVGAAGAATVYYQAHGLLDAGQPTFGRMPLPAGARLVLQRNDLVLPRLAYLPVANFSSGGGFLAAISIAFVAPNLNTLEGCFHFYPTASTPYPGQLHSTGTEDEFRECASGGAGVAARRLPSVLPPPPPRFLPAPCHISLIILLRPGPFPGQDRGPLLQAGRWHYCNVAKLPGRPANLGEWRLLCVAQRRHE